MAQDISPIGNDWNPPALGFGVAACIAPSFSAAVEPDAGASPLTVQFTLTKLAGNAPLQYLWNFGDGDTSTEQSPQHTYASEGVYDVQVIISNHCGQQVIELGPILVDQV